MGASGWDYSVPYQEDLGVAFADLRREVFVRHDYWWVGEDDGQPWPSTEQELWQDEDAQEAGTHSILDVHRVIGVEEKADYGTLQPVGEDEAFQLFGTRKPTSADVPDLIALPFERWQGRCAVVYDEEGVPQKFYFWGCSGD